MYTTEGHGFRTFSSRRHIRHLLYILSSVAIRNDKDANLRLQQENENRQGLIEFSMQMHARFILNTRTGTASSLYERMSARAGGWEAMLPSGKLLR